MLKILFIIPLIFLTQQSFGQALNPISVTIKGTIIDSLTQTELGFASVTLKDQENPNHSQTTISESNGYFQVEATPNKKYLLSISYVGFDTEIIEVLSSSSSIKDLGVLKLSPVATQLEEVQVIGERVLIEFDLDKLTYNVELDSESNTFSAFEMFRKVPMISIDGEDNIQLNGNTSYQILINGQTSSLFVQNPSDVFKSMPANAIKSIEVITNPPARFDAEGVGGIINVITHRKSVSGYNGNVNVGVMSPSGTLAGGYLSGKVSKVGFSSTFGTKSNLSPQAGSEFVRKDKINSLNLTQRGTRISESNFTYFSTELSYELAPLTLLKANYRVNRSLGFTDFNQAVELQNIQNEVIQSYKNLSDGYQKSNSSDFLMELLQNFHNNPQRTLSSSFKISSNSLFNTSVFSVQPLVNHEGQNSVTENENITRDYTFQLDYVHPIKRLVLEAGIKSHVRRNLSDYFYQNQNPETGLFSIDLNQSNNFEYSQSINAGYTSVRFSLKKWRVISGLRLEETSVNANFRSSGTVASQHLYNLIPNFSVSHELKNGKPLRLSYTQRLERPQMFHLNPYINLIDPRNISFGNPELQPVSNHVINLGYNTYLKETSLNISLNHTFSNNSIQYFTLLGADTVARSTFGNIGQRKIYSLNLGGNTTLFKNLMISINNTTNYTILSRYVGDQQIHRKGFFHNLNSHATYRFNKSWRASGNFGFISSQVLIQGKSAGYFSNSLAVNREFLKNNMGMLSFSIQNPLQRYRRYINEVDEIFFYQFQQSYSVIREFSLNFSYRFGKVQGGNPGRKTHHKKIKNH